MLQSVTKATKKVYQKIITSIAFLPAIIAIGFLLLSFIMIWFDSSDTGKSFKAGLHWLSLKDASTARSICTAIASGVISLAVFSFSMVMIVLNQAASQMSNRILDKLIGNRFQQVVLGFYIGTIIYALFLLSTIRDVDSGIYVPAISAYLLIALTVFDIFLFIYFLHYITDAVKYETIIGKLHTETKEEMLIHSCEDKAVQFVPEQKEGTCFYAHKSGIFQGIDKKQLVAICQEENVTLCCLFIPGEFVLKGTPILFVNDLKVVSEEFRDKVALQLNIGPGQSIKTNFYNGFQQLMEIALKALSPGINDPDTAVLALQALFDLIAIRTTQILQTHLPDDDGNVRVITRYFTCNEMIERFIFPIWDYGKEDRLIQQELLSLMLQLKNYGAFENFDKLEIAIKSNLVTL